MHARRSMSSMAATIRSRCPRDPDERRIRCSTRFSTRSPGGLSRRDDLSALVSRLALRLPAGMFRRMPALGFFDGMGFREAQIFLGHLHELPVVLVQRLQ